MKIRICGANSASPAPGRDRQPHRIRTARAHAHDHDVGAMPAPVFNLNRSRQRLGSRYHWSDEFARSPMFRAVAIERPRSSSGGHRRRCFRRGGSGSKVRVPLEHTRQLHGRYGFGLSRQPSGKIKSQTAKREGGSESRCRVSRKDLNGSRPTVRPSLSA